MESRELFESAFLIVVVITFAALFVMWLMLDAQTHYYYLKDKTRFGNWIRFIESLYINFKNFKSKSSVDHSRINDHTDQE